MLVLQGNMHRSKTADDLLEQIVLEKEADIVLISEQYCKQKDGTWITDPSNTAAIWVPKNKNLSIKEKGSGHGFVWIKVRNIIFVSCYLTPSDSIENFNRKLNEIEDTLRDKNNIIVGGDFNSKAVEWGSNSTNSRGGRIMDMAARIGLSVANIGKTPTFRRPGCQGTILGF